VLDRNLRPWLTCPHAHAGHRRFHALVRSLPVLLVPPLFFKASLPIDTDKAPGRSVQPTAQAGSIAIQFSESCFGSFRK
jgi:hypothetical protein